MQEIKTNTGRLLK